MDDMDFEGGPMPTFYLFCKTFDDGTDVEMRVPYRPYQQDYQSAGQFYMQSIGIGWYPDVPELNTWKHRDEFAEWVKGVSKMFGCDGLRIDGIHEEMEIVSGKPIPKFDAEA